MSPSTIATFVVDAGSEAICYIKIIGKHSRSVISSQTLAHLPSATL